MQQSKMEENSKKILHLGMSNDALTVELKQCQHDLSIATTSINNLTQQNKQLSDTMEIIVSTKDKQIEEVSVY